MVPYEFRWARAEDWEPAMKMIWKTFLKYEASDYTQEGIESFLDFITDDKLYEYFLIGDYRMMIVLDNQEIVGAASIRNKNHLSLLFVDERYHYKGIGSTLIQKLCAYLKMEIGEHLMTLMAAPYALGFYQKLGFRIISPEREFSGIRVTFMEKNF